MCVEKHNISMFFVLSFSGCNHRRQLASFEIKSIKQFTLNKFRFFNRRWLGVTVINVDSIESAVDVY